MKQTPAVKAVLKILNHPSVDVEAFPNPLAVYVEDAIREAEAAVHAKYAEILKAADWMDEAINAGSRSEKRWEDKPASEAYRAARAKLKGE